MKLLVNFKIIALFILLGLLSGYSQNIKLLLQNPKVIFSTEKIFLPIVMNGIPEIDPPPGRWLHTAGQTLPVTYRYIAELNDTNHRWRQAFASGFSSWNSTDTLTSLYLHSQSENTISMINDPTEYSGVTYLYITNGVLTKVDVYGNYYWESVFGWSSVQRSSITAHEIGHMQGVGHIPRTYPVTALMYKSRSIDEIESFYFPQSPDVALINQVYP